MNFQDKKLELLITFISNRIKSELTITSEKDLNPDFFSLIYFHVIGYNNEIGYPSRSYYESVVNLSLILHTLSQEYNLSIPRILPTLILEKNVDYWKLILTEIRFCFFNSESDNVTRASAFCLSGLKAFSTPINDIDLSTKPSIDYGILNDVTFKEQNLTSDIERDLAALASVDTDFLKLTKKSFDSTNQRMKILTEFFSNQSLYNNTTSTRDEGSPRNLNSKSSGFESGENSYQSNRNVIAKLRRQHARLSLDAASVCFELAQWQLNHRGALSPSLKKTLISMDENLNKF